MLLLNNFKQIKLHEENLYNVLFYIVNGVLIQAFSPYFIENNIISTSFFIVGFALLIIGLRKLHEYSGCTNKNEIKEIHEKENVIWPNSIINKMIFKISNKSKNEGDLKLKNGLKLKSPHVTKF